VKFEHIQFLSVEHVEDGHNLVLSVSDGSPGVRDRGLLESAVMAPRAGYYDSLAEMAAVYAHGIAKNHAFVDGNKRTALGAAESFLDMNGFPLDLDQKEWADVMVAVAEGSMSRAELAERFAAAMGEPGRIE
jgi:death on curing protein